MLLKNIPFLYKLFLVGGDYFSSAERKIDAVNSSLWPDQMIRLKIVLKMNLSRCNTPLNEISSILFTLNPYYKGGAEVKTFGHMEAV